jgi:endonuclease YncB( thermonuclease family)
MTKLPALALLLGFCLAPLSQTPAAVWKKLEGWQLDGDNQPEDGDSFKVRKVAGKRTLRLYGIDCPEIHNRFPDQIRKQAQALKLKPEDIPAWGLKAKAFTADFLKNGFSIEECGEKAPNDRQYGIVRNLKGERLDEALLKAGLAIVDRTQEKNMAPYIEGEETVPANEEDKTWGRFANKLQHLETEARRAKLGFWGGKELPPDGIQKAH